MKKINELLSRFKNLKNNPLLTKEATQRAVREILNISIPIKKINYRNGSININLSGPIKSEIILKREEIKKTINKILGPNKINSVR